MLLAIVASWLTLGNVDFACETPEVPVILTHGTSIIIMPSARKAWLPLTNAEALLEITLQSDPPFRL